MVRNLNGWNKAKGNFSLEQGMKAQKGVGYNPTLPLTLPLDRGG